MNKKELISLLAKALGEKTSLNDLEILQRKVLSGEGLFSLIDILDRAIETKKAEIFQAQTIPCNCSPYQLENFGHKCGRD